MTAWTLIGVVLAVLVVALFVKEVRWYQYKKEQERQLEASWLQAKYQPYLDALNDEEWPDNAEGLHKVTVYIPEVPSTEGQEVTTEATEGRERAGEGDSAVNTGLAEDHRAAVLETK